jgi:hypothetical protein
MARVYGEIPRLDFDPTRGRTIIWQVPRESDLAWEWSGNPDSRRDARRAIDKKEL